MSEDEWKEGDQDRRNKHVVDAAEHIIKAAKSAAETLEYVTEENLRKIAAAVSNAQSVANLDLSYLKKDVMEIKLMLESKYVTKEAFIPVKSITFGLVGIIMVGVVGSLMTLLLRSH